MTEPLIVIQARVSSTRLPAKVLLPLGGHPLGVLCALRAQNAGGRVVLATSTHESDDPLAEHAGAAAITYMRGPLNDVLARFELVAAKQGDDGIVVRLTADNPFPDGHLIDEMVAHFVREDLAFLTTSVPSNSEPVLPYGLSAEVFRVRTLRGAAAKSFSASDREHVTPWMVRSARSQAVFRPIQGRPGWGKLRCTVDTLEDYIRAFQVFARVNDPVEVGWEELCAILEEVTERSSSENDG